MVLIVPLKHFNNNFSLLKDEHVFFITRKSDA